ncbi:MAG: LytTR family DNA-binding domain-containing protein [Spirochaetales bacterium]|nr:LytTR family DNA-binding domain-containing protein [Spirochaetales bacterium]
MRILIVDDEKPAREELRFLIESGGVDLVVGEASDGFEALKGMELYHPEVILMDISMPGMTGLEAASQIAETPSPPKIVFITAFDQFALEAFEVRALDYLLKPVDSHRLKRTLDRLRKETREGIQEQLSQLHDVAFSQANASMNHASAKSKSQRITVYHEGHFVPIQIDEILYLKAEGRSSSICTESGNFSCRRNLSDLAALLNPHTFYRCHRGYVVNLEKISTVDPRGDNCYALGLRGGQETIPLSRSHAAEFRQLMNMD